MIITGNKQQMETVDDIVNYQDVTVGMIEVLKY